jgi:hypothetical protein
MTRLSKFVPQLSEGSSRLEAMAQLMNWTKPQNSIQPRSQSILNTILWNSRLGLVMLEAERPDELRSTSGRVIELN